MGKRIYEINESFFEKIDNEYKAYILGFFYADGYLTKRKCGQNVSGMKLKNTENSHLENMFNFITNKKPKYYENITKYGLSKSCQIDLVSDKIFNDLIKLGCIENKSLILKFPTEEQVLLHLIHHFIRGYFDGDGSVYFLNQKANNKIYESIGINICGTHEFIISLLNVCNLLINCIYKEKRKVTNCWNLKLSCKLRCKKLFDIMYNNSNIYLERKFSVFKHFFGDVQRL